MEKDEKKKIEDLQNLFAIFLPTVPVLVHLDEARI